jgi:hypothetical protein
MAQGDPQGWESLGANDPLLYKANLRLNRETGGGQTKQNIKVVTNRDNGNYDVYSTAFGAGDKKLFGYNASDNKIVVDPNNRATYDQFFTGPRSQQLTDLNKSVKQATLKLAENNVSGGSGSASQAALDRLKNGPGYKPTAAAPKITPPGANPNGADPAAGGSVPAGPPESGNVREGTKTGPNSFGNFVYPEGIRNSKQDVIKFTMLEYKPSGVGAFQPAGKSARESLTKGIPTKDPGDRIILGSVVLPIPNNISDTNSMNWGSDDMNALEAALAAAAFTGITGGIGEGVQSFGKSMEAFVGDDKSGKALGATFAAAAVRGNNAEILSRAEGAVINPNLELLFNGPQLRPFNFTFKLAAREKKESDNIIKILNFFKRGSSAIRTESNLFLKAPHTFHIQYLHMGQSGEDHPFIGRIKECALQSITTSYTPEGQYATFSDGVMVSYQITMQFSELEPIFNDDYNELTGIGF